MTIVETNPELNPMHPAVAALQPYFAASVSELQAPETEEKVRALFSTFLDAIESGAVRSASHGLLTSGNSVGHFGWRVHADVKQAILVGFRLGRLVAMGDAALPFVDKDTYPVRHLTVQDKVRVVPGGSSVRRGAHVASSVTVMPPAYINVGSFVDEGTMVDSHALVGSCAQIGKRVHLSAAAQIGGVLEPVGAMPVIVEDDVLVGGGVGIYEGTRVGKRAVLAAGVILTSSTKIYDAVNEKEIVANEEGVLVVPEGAVVVPGSRPMRGAYAEKHGLHLATPIIVKYRDEKTDAKTLLENALR